MRIILMILLTIAATNVKADAVNGPEAVKLVLKAKKKGLIYEVFKNHEGIALIVFVDNRYYECALTEKGQSCTDYTDYRKKE